MAGQGFVTGRPFGWLLLGRPTALLFAGEIAFDLFKPERKLIGIETLACLVRSSPVAGWRTLPSEPSMTFGLKLPRCRAKAVSGIFSTSSARALFGSRLMKPRSSCPWSFVL